MAKYFKRTMVHYNRIGKGTWLFHDIYFKTITDNTIQGILDF